MNNDEQSRAQPQQPPVMGIPRQMGPLLDHGTLI